MTTRIFFISTNRRCWWCRFAARWHYFLWLKTLFYLKFSIFVCFFLFFCFKITLNPKNTEIFSTNKKSSVFVSINSMVFFVSLNFYCFKFLFCFVSFCALVSSFQLFSLDFCFNFFFYFLKDSILKKVFYISFHLMPKSI